SCPPPAGSTAARPFAGRPAAWALRERSCRRRARAETRASSRSSPAGFDCGGLFLLAAEEVGVRALRCAADLFVGAAALEREEVRLGFGATQARDCVQNRPHVLRPALARHLDQRTDRAPVTDGDQR